MDAIVGIDTTKSLNHTMQVFVQNATLYDNLDLVVVQRTSSSLNPIILFSSKLNNFTAITSTVQR